MLHVDYSCPEEAEEVRQHRAHAYEFIHEVYTPAYIFAIIEKAPLYLDTVFSKPFFSGIV